MPHNIPFCGVRVRRILGVIIAFPFNDRYCRDNYEATLGSNYDFNVSSNGLTVYHRDRSAIGESGIALWRGGCLIVVGLNAKATRQMELSDVIGDLHFGRKVYHQGSTFVVKNSSSPLPVAAYTLEQYEE